MNNVTTLRREQHQYREQKPNERPGACPFQKDLVIPSWTCRPAESEAREDCCAQRNAEEDGDAFRGGGILKIYAIAADDLDEEDAHRCE